MKICTATFSSLTYAMKAQKALAADGIFSKIVSIDPALTKRGCSYGLEFSCSEEQTVRRILRKNGIRVGQFLSFDGGILL